MTTKTKQRNHNEYFRRVFVKTIWGDKYREPELIDEILARPDNTLTREQLELPYNSVLRYESARKSCPTCGTKLLPGQWIYSWGEYAGGPTWRTVKHFCDTCVVKEVVEPLKAHDAGCGCRITIVNKDGCDLPEALTKAFDHCD